MGVDCRACGVEEDKVPHHYLGLNDIRIQGLELAWGIELRLRIQILGLRVEARKRYGHDKFTLFIRQPLDREVAQRPVSRFFQGLLLQFYPLYFIGSTGLPFEYGLYLKAIAKW